MKAQSRLTLVVQEPLPNKTIWSFQGLREKNFPRFFAPKKYLKFNISIRIQYSGYYPGYLKMFKIICFTAFSEI